MILARFWRLIKSWINGGIDKAEKSNPKLQLEQLLSDANTNYGSLRQAVAQAMASEKLAIQHRDDEVANSKKWEMNAMNAVKAGRDDLAEIALKKKQEHDSKAEIHEKTVREAAIATNQLRVQLRETLNKIEEMESRKNILVAKSNRIAARNKIQESLDKFNGGSSFAAFDKLESELNTMEATIDAKEELIAEENNSNADMQFREWENRETSNAALANLKARMGLVPATTPEAATTPNVAKTAEEIESEFRELEREAEQSVSVRR